MLLLKFVVDIGPRDEDNNSPLDLAMVRGREDMVKILVEHAGGSEHDFNYFIGAARVLEAARYANEARMLKLLDELPDHRHSKTDLGRALWRAVSSGNIDPVRALLSKGADARANHLNRCVLCLAFTNTLIPKERRRPLMDLLEEHGAEPDDIEKPADRRQYRTYRMTTTTKMKKTQKHETQDVANPPE